jgi:hypothetical protein
LALEVLAPGEFRSESPASNAWRRIPACRSAGARSCQFGTDPTNSNCVARHQNVGVTQVGDRIWLVTFMQYDLGYFDDETCRLEPIENPFGPKVLPMSPE